jgi:hypothetical protein
MDGKNSDLAKELFSDKKKKDEILKKMSTSKPVLGLKFKANGFSYVITDGSSYKKELQKIKDKDYLALLA